MSIADQIPRHGAPIVRGMPIKSIRKVAGSFLTENHRGTTVCVDNASRATAMKNGRFNDHMRVRIKGDWCTYCGEPAESDEHYPPATCTSVGFILPACRECNNLAGTIWPYDFERRAEYVKNQIRQRNKKYVFEGGWTEYEAEKYRLKCKYLKSVVIKWQRRADLVKRRLAWNVASYLACIDHNNSIAQVDAEIKGLLIPEETNSNLSENLRNDLKDVLLNSIRRMAINNLLRLSHR